MLMPTTPITPHLSLLEHQNEAFVCLAKADQMGSPLRLSPVQFQVYKEFIKSARYHFDAVVRLEKAKKQKQP